MSDRIIYAVSAIPVETLTTENNTEKDVIASEVNTNLGGSSESVDLADYSGTAANQGYKDGAVNYLEASYSATDGTKLSATTPDFIFIRNTGFRYSSATELGDSSADYVMIVAKTLGWVTSSQSGWVEGQGDTSQVHYFELGWLAPGAAMILPAGAAKNSISQYGANNFDLSKLNLDAADYGDMQIYCKTFKSDGSAATSSNAVEFLCVT